MNLIVKVLLIGSIWCSSLSVLGQVVLDGANGSSTSLIPLSTSKKALRKLTSSADLRTDYVRSKNNYLIAAYDTVPTKEIQEEISKIATYVGYIPRFIYIYKAKDAVRSAAAIEALLKEKAKTALVGVGAMPWQFKLGDAIYQEYSKTGKLSPELSNAGIDVSVFSPEDLSALKATLEHWERQYEEVSKTVVRIKVVDLDFVKQVAVIPYVNYVAPYVAPTPEKVGEDPGIRYIMRSNAIDIVNYDRKGPIGRGVYFMNWEDYGKEDYFALSSYGRTLPGNLSDNRSNDHGSTVGVIVAGANNLGEWQTGGMAPGMTYVSSVKYGNMARGAQQVMEAGYSPLVTNYSVGWTKGDVNYGGDARDIDELIYRSNTYLHFFSAGNSSDGTYNGYPKQGYSTITGSHKTSKNGFIVHSSSFPGVNVGFASFGPTKDGRMKPDIAAEGTAGTSYASPGTAGLAGLLMEQYKTTYGSAARADVIKALILNTALRVRVFTDLDTNIKVDTVNHITYRSGFGQINPLAAVEALKEKRIIIGDKVQQGETREYTIEIPEGQAEARFLLYYNDVSGTVGANKTLVNDLDLVVIDPDGNEFLPWTLDPSPNKVHLPPTRTVNRRDNVEQVVLTAPTKDQLLKPGVYKFRVRGYEVPVAANSPEYVLTWQTRPRGIRMTSLPAGYRVAVGNDLLLTWDMTLPLNENKLVGHNRNAGLTPTVSYRKNESEKWTVIAPSHYGANYSLITTQTEMGSNELQFRVTLGEGLEAVSNKIQVTPRVGDSPEIVELFPKHVVLRWSAAPAEVSSGTYYIHALYDKYMTVLDSVDFPNLEARVEAPEGVTFDKNVWFAVSYKNGVTNAYSQRSKPVSLDQLNKYSFTNYHWSHLTYALCGDDTINLPTIPQYDIVQWYRMEGDNSVPIAAEEGGNKRSRTFTSSTPGRFYYTASSGTPSKIYYTSLVVTINTPKINVADAVNFGDYIWAGSVFYDKDANPGVNLTDKIGLPYYGRFTLNTLGFDSNSQLFGWRDDNMMSIPGYVGCDTPGSSNNHLIVMKRRGFKPGNYVFTIERAAHKARIIFRDREGNVLGEVHSARNSTGEPPYSIYLDENSTCELQWIGEHFKLKVDIPPYTPPTVSPLEDGALYRIKSALSAYQQQQNVEKALYVDYESNKVKWKTHAMTHVSEIFQIDGSYTRWRNTTIIDVNRQRFLSTPGDLSNTQSMVALESLGDGQYKIKANGRIYHTNGHGNGSGVEGTLVSWDGGKNSASAWYFEKVNHVYLRVGDVGYATAYYPFSIKVPNLRGFAMFKPVRVEDGGGAIVLHRLSPGTTVYAKTPIIIEAFPGNYAIELDYDNLETEAERDPSFRGITYPTKISARAYVMSYHQTKGIGFYPVKNDGMMSVAKLGANRVYYLPDYTHSSPQFLSFKFDDVTTGVHSLQKEEQKKQYDISGKPAFLSDKGLIITSEGKKVYNVEQ